MKERTAVTLDEDLVEYLKRRAENERTTVSALLNQLVAREMASEKGRRRK